MVALGEVTSIFSDHTVAAHLSEKEMTVCQALHQAWGYTVRLNPLTNTTREEFNHGLTVEKVKLQRD